MTSIVLVPVRCCSVRSSGSDRLDLYVPPIRCFPIFLLLLGYWRLRCGKPSWHEPWFHFFLCVWVMPDFMGVEFLADMSWCINFCIGILDIYFRVVYLVNLLGEKLWTLTYSLWFLHFSCVLDFKQFFLWASKILVWIYFEWWHYNTNLLEWRSLAICRGSINQI